MLGRAVHEIAEEAQVGRGQIDAIDILADAMLGELADDRDCGRAALLPLIECLHRGETCRAALHRRLARLLGRCLAQFVSPNLRRMATIDSTASAAPPPLSFSAMRARVQACSSFSTVRMPLPIQTA